MSACSVPADEDARLAALAEYDLRPSSENTDFSRLVNLAARLFGVQAAFVSIVERDRQFFVCKTGLDLEQTDRDVSFCSYTIAQNESLIVLDARTDPRFAHNPLVLGGPQIRFYAGVPLRTPSGHGIGSFCITDTKPRAAFTGAERSNLEDIAKLVVDLLEMRRLELASRISQSRFASIAATSPDGILCADRHGKITVFNGAAQHLFGHAAEQALGQPIEMIMPERMRNGHANGMKRVVGGAAPKLIGKTVELTAVHRDGTEFPVELSLSMWTEDGHLAFGSIIRDVRERRANEERLFRLAHNDNLTGLPNRLALFARTAEILEAGRSAALLMIDIDGFKEVNETLGHVAGDKLLQLAADRLKAFGAPHEVVARVGGDEFAILSPDRDAASTAMLAKNIVAEMARQFVLEEEVFNLGASVGFARGEGHEETAQELLACAELALYRAKADGRHCHRAFTPDLKHTAVERRANREDLHRATVEGEFVLFYQPQVRLADGALCGAEALLRWRHPDRGLVGPAAFLAMLENSRHAAAVGDWVMRTACLQAARWRKFLPTFRMGVNLFGAQCRTGQLPSKVMSALDAAGLPVEALELEITENIILTHDGSQIATFRTLHEAGVGIAFDDYGTGYASLSQLKAFPLTRLKIDRSFVRGMCENRQDAAIIRAILGLSDSFGLDVIAEGVETEEQRLRLSAKGCLEAQGYLFSWPLSCEQFEAKYELGAARTGAGNMQAA